MLAEDAAERAWSIANGLEAPAVGAAPDELGADIARWAARLAESGDDTAVAALAERGWPVGA